jgi:beta-lactamase regulating signal transducer with metallopeptidase domain
MDWAADATELLWIGGVTAVPLALLVTLSCKWPGCRPATRHAMWAAVLLSFVTPALASLLWRPSWFQSHRVLAGAAVAIDRLESGLRLDVGVSPPPPAATVAERSAGAPSMEGAAPARQESLRVTTPRQEAIRSRGPATNEMPRVAREALPLAAAVEGVRASGPGVEWFESAARDLAAPTSEVRRPARSTPPATPAHPAAAARKPVVERAGASGVSPERTAEPMGVVRTWGNEAKEWLAGALLVRDSIAQLPPLPIAVWGVGAVAVLAAGGVRVASFRRDLRHARPASVETMRLVEATAAELGLRRVPLTVVTGTRVSPMVWCGRRPRLVLPVGLWRELDESSRRAVLLHELAHLKRRDHWLCWLATLVGVVYWWHPVAWWARKRVRDEADAACDAWVTSLMPAARRAYAEALVTTKWYLSAAGTRAPSGFGAAGAGGLGVMSGRTKQLARRLQMVMTQRVAPRTSMAGALVALGVLATGMFVMPGLACPPEEAAKAREHAAKSAAHAADVHAKMALEHAAKASSQAKSKSKRADAKQGEGVEFYGEAPALEAMRRHEGAAKRPEGAREEEMMQRLEERLRKLEEHLRRLEEKGPRAGAGAPAGAMGVFSTNAPRSAGQAETRAGAGQAVRAYSVARSPQAPIAIAEGGPDVAREYRLPEGKLQALANLMIREDVPVLIESHGDKIVVHAPEGKQRVFAAFVHLIHPGAEAPQGMWMTVPAPEGVPGRPSAEAFRKDQERQVEQLRRQLREMEQQQRSTERSAERARERSDAFENDMETMHERLESLQERRAESTDAATSARLEAEVQSLGERIAAKSAEFSNLIAQVAASEDVQARIEAAIEQLEATIENITESLEEEIEEMVDDAMTEGVPAPAPAAVVSTRPLAVRVAPTPGLPPTPSVGGLAPVPPVPPVAPVAPVGAAPSPSTRPAPPAPAAPPAPPATPAPSAPEAAPTPVAEPAPASLPTAPSPNV